MNSPSLSVFIPTANRPDYLRTALSSVAAQSAVDIITEVLVSENLGNRDSEKVCAEFPQLPIRYTLREPQLGHPRHLGILAQETSGDLVALLNDDDWWAPGHLASGQAALQRNPRACAWFSATVWTASEQTNEGHIHREGSLWLAAGEPDDWMTEWPLEPAGLIPVCWMYAPFHWTTMIGRREAIHDSVRDLETEHAWNADRIIPARLASHGPVLYQPQATAFARTHEGNWAADPDKVAQMKQADAAWVKTIATIADEHGVNLIETWKKWQSKLPAESAWGFARSLERHYPESEIASMGFSDFLSKHTRTKGSLLKRAIRAAMPYGLVEGFRHRQQG